MTQPVSVLHFSNSPVRGGAEEHILTLLGGLDRKYFRLHLVCPPETAARLQHDLPSDVELIPLTLSRPTQVASAFRLACLLRERQVKILHSHQFYSSLFASPIGGICRVPVIIETPHLRESWRTGRIKSSFAVDRAVGRFVDYYIAVSNSNARYLVESKRLPPKKVIVIHNGCDLRRFDSLRHSGNAVRGGLGLSESDPMVVVVGRLEAQKGHRVLLDAFVQVCAEFPEACLVCVGEGSLRGELEKQTAELGLAEAVRFVGFQSNVPDWLAAADLMVLPSFYEGLPIVAVESLAAARPVVATAVDGTPEVVLDGKTGLTVPPGDAGALSAALCRLLRDADLRQRMGQEGRRWVAENFTRERQIQRTQDLYLHALEQRLLAWKDFRREGAKEESKPQLSAAAPPRVN
jgi:glycosyltransferase involved in cell wall biosynthesis